jgi:acyl-CoA reductase-like NAD-dependent aldehyde dehydrogenase
MGEIEDSVRPGVDVELRRESLGVIGIITPWTSPMAVAAWKLAPALAFDNTVILKPAELVPATAWILAEIISRSGLPKGVLNLVIGPKQECCEATSTSKDIDAITLNDSVPVGRHIVNNVIKKYG